MEDRYGKYVRLFTTLVITLLGLLIAFVLLLLSIRLFFGLLSYIPWSTYIYVIFILSVPSMLFISIYIIYFKRTAFHPSALVRYISYSVFTIALIAWGIFLVKDIISFSKFGYTEIEKYYTYNMPFLAGNVAAIFLIAVMQALSIPEGKDWMEKNNQV